MERKNDLAFSLLKILCIWFVVGMHFLSHGGYLSNALLASGLEVNMVWLVRSFIMVCVNCFVLITGYYQSSKDNIKTKKCFSLMDAMLFYSIAISILLVIVFQEKLSTVQLIYTVFPFSTKSYWYMTCYIVLYLMSPFINRAIVNLSSTELGRVLAVSITLFSIIPTVFNSICTTLDDTNGFGICWFVILYLTGCWLRKSKFQFKHGIVAPGLYIVCSMLTFCISVLTTWLGNNYYAGFQEYAISNIGYNYLPVYIGSVALFLTFSQMKVSLKFEKVIKHAASCTGGYILSTNSRFYEMSYLQSIYVVTAI